MKQLIFIILLSYQYIGFSQTDSLADEGNTMLLMQPEGYNTIKKATGLLNNDEYQDFAIVVQSTNTDHLEINPITQDTTNLNPRILAIYFGNDKGHFRKPLQVNNFILLKTEDHIRDPIIDFTITKDGSLKIDFKLYTYLDGWMNTHYSYLFKHQNSAFNLIKYQSNSKHNLTRKAIEHKIDFLKGKKTITTTTLDENNKEEVVKTKNKFKLKNLKSLKDLQTPFNWEFMGINI